MRLRIMLIAAIVVLDVGACGLLLDKNKPQRIPNLATLKKRAKEIDTNDAQQIVQLNILDQFANKELSIYQVTTIFRYSYSNSPDEPEDSSKLSDTLVTILFTNEGQGDAL